MPVIDKKTLLKHHLPPDFSPQHPEYKVPSKRNRYMQLLRDIDKDVYLTSTPVHVAKSSIQTHAGSAGFPINNEDAPAIGIAISTYFGPDTKPERLAIFLTSIYSLLASGFPGKIIVVDDGSYTHQHLFKISEIQQIKIIYKRQNGGVAISKNTGIKNLPDCDYVFLADDDMIYNGKWWEKYIGAYKKTGIPYFAFRAARHEFPWGDYPEKAIIKDGIMLRCDDHPNGCLMFFHKSAIAAVGGFKVLPYAFGYEHLDMTQRLIKAKVINCSYDVFGSNDCLHLSIESNNIRSVVVDTVKIMKQQAAALQDDKIQQPIEE